MTLAPRIVRAPSRAAWLTPGARIEHVTCGEVAIGPLARREFRRIALFTPQTTEIVKSTSPELCVAVPARRSEYCHEQERDEVRSISSGRHNQSGSNDSIRTTHAHGYLSKSFLKGAPLHRRNADNG